MFISLFDEVYPQISSPFFKVCKKAIRTLLVLIDTVLV